MLILQILGINFRARTLYRSCADLISLVYGISRVELINFVFLILLLVFLVFFLLFLKFVCDFACLFVCFFANCAAKSRRICLLRLFFSQLGRETS